MSDWRPMAAAMTEQLMAKGELTVPAWRQAFQGTPRHLFVPDHSRTDAYAQDALVTQWVADDMGNKRPTSSLSAPAAVAVMLERLDVQEGHRVLEIGTGTGYNAALLAHRLGPANVTSIEIDPQVADQARQALATAGYPVTVITADGAKGYPPHAPYDRIISTASVQQVPYPWVAQTRAGGKILTPWGSAYHNGALVCLTVAGNGSAQGRIVGNVSFMLLRGQRIYASVDDEECDQTTARQSHTRIDRKSVV